MNFSVPFTVEDGMRLINEKYEFCKNFKDSKPLDDLIEDIQEDLEKLKEQNEVLNLVKEAVDLMKNKIENEIVEDKEKEKRKHIEDIKNNIGPEIAEKFNQKVFKDENKK